MKKYLTILLFISCKAPQKAIKQAMATQTIFQRVSALEAELREIKSRTIYLDSTQWNIKNGFARMRGKQSFDSIIAKYVYVGIPDTAIKSKK